MQPPAGAEDAGARRRGATARPRLRPAPGGVERTAAALRGDAFLPDHLRYHLR